MMTRKIGSFYPPVMVWLTTFPRGLTTCSSVNLIDGTSDYAMVVYKGGLATSDLE